MRSGYVKVPAEDFDDSSNHPSPLQSPQHEHKTSPIRPIFHPTNSFTKNSKETLISTTINEGEGLTTSRESATQVITINNDNNNNNNNNNNTDLEMGRTSNSGSFITVTILRMGEERHEIEIDLNWTVKELKERRFKKMIEEKKTIRLIYQGKLLLDPEKLSSYKLKPNAFIHAVISTQKGLQSDPNFVPPPISEDCNGFIPDEQLARMLQRREGVDRDEDRTDVLYSDANGDGTNRNSGEVDSRDFACGFFLGLMLGVWSFFFMVFSRRYRSRRFRLGVFLGGMLNLMINALSTSADTGGGNHHNNGDGTTSSTGDDTSSSAGSSTADDGSTTIQSDGATGMSMLRNLLWNK